MGSYSRIAVLALTALLLAVPFAPAPRASAQAPVTVRFGVDQFIFGSPVLVADEIGIFRKYGVRPVIQPFAYGIDTIDAILAGRSDVGFAIDFPMLLRLATGRLRIVANIIEPEPGFHQLAARPGITGGADMRGKRLGIAQGTAQHYITIRYLQISGVQPGDAQLVPLPSLFEIVAALRRGSIDAAWVWAQGTDEARQIPGVRILADDGVVQSPSFGYMAVGAQFLAQSSDAMVNVLRAMVEATDWQNRNLPQAAKIISRRNGAPENTTLVELRRQHSVVSLERKHINALVSLLDFMIDNNLLRTRLAVPDFFVIGPLKQAAPDRVKI